MDQPLPTFGIRHLRDDEPFSLLSINERQYETTLEWHPYAALSYVDEDDGENVTIGSGLELKQRLDDQPTLPAPSVHAFNPVKDRFEDRFIHLFDIQQGELCRAVWKRNQTVSAGGSAQSRIKASNDDNDSISHIDLNSEYHDLGSDNEPNKSRMLEHTATEQSSVQHVNLMDAIPDLVDNLANLLQSTSETLRKAAQKSRTTRTSPIEDVMSGMSKIVAEVGGFGLSLLDSVSPAHSSVPQSQLSPSKDIAGTPKVDIPSVADCESEIKDPSSTVSVVGSTVSQRRVASQQIASSSISPKASATRANKCDFCSTMDLACQPTSDSTILCQHCATLGLPCLDRLGLERSSVARQRLSSTSTSSFATVVSKENSILDQDSEDEDADFSRRYPPLISLRRANTVAGLHDRFTEPQSCVRSNNELTRHSSWIKRYPHRPIPYVLDAETQRRRGFAQNCFPTQRYNSGIDLQTNLPLLGQSIPSKPDAPVTEPSNSASTVQPPIKTFTLEFPPSKDANTSLVDSKPSPTVQIVTSASVKLVDNVVNHPAPTTKASSSSEEPKCTIGQLSDNVPLAESSGAFFHRMMRDQLPKQQEHVNAIEERFEHHKLARPKSMYLHRPNNNNPFSKLDRSQTVSSATNPASRLNRPFDPWYPTVASNTQSDSQATLSGTTVPTKVQEEVSKPRTSSTTDRGSGLQRPFSPVWEDHLKPAKITEIPGAYPTEVINEIDRNGESSSMYSPPPRHMRSVPNLTRSTSMTTAVPSADVTVSEPTLKRGTSVLARNPSLTDPITGRYRAFPPQQPLKPNTNQIDAPPRPSNPFRMILQPATASSMPQQNRVPPFPLTTPTNGPGPKVLPRKPVSRSRAQKTSPSDRATQECLTALQDMGYGIGDNSLKSRLHIYAEAANGDVTDAVDMIEEDKRASKRQADGRVSL